jgi:hypothetical protein
VTAVAWPPLHAAGGGGQVAGSGNQAQAGLGQAAPAQEGPAQAGPGQEGSAQEGPGREGLAQAGPGLSGLRQGGPGRSSAVRGGMFGEYATAVLAELAVVRGAPDAAERIAAARRAGEENAWAAACLERAVGRLRKDRDALEESVRMWERIGAVHERDVTLRLLRSLHT